MISLHLGDENAEFRCFASALSAIFRGERWDEVAPHARRAWNACEMSTTTPWEDVVDRLRDGWPESPA